MPKKVYIISDKLCDHGPFDENRLKEAETRGLAKHEVQVLKEDLYKAAQTIKDWLVESGVPEEIIFIEESFNVDNKKNITKTGNWILFDRHNAKADRSGIYSKTYEGVKSFHLPFGDFYRTAQEQGLLPEINPEEFKKSLEETFENLLVKSGAK